MTNVIDISLKDEMMKKLQPDQKWLKSDIERLLQLSNVFTNDRVVYLRMIFYRLNVNAWKERSSI